MLLTASMFGDPSAPSPLFSIELPYVLRTVLLPPFVTEQVTVNPAVRKLLWSDKKVDVCSHGNVESFSRCVFRFLV
jgi:hypothetical protein